MPPTKADSAADSTPGTAPVANLDPQSMSLLAEVADLGFFRVDADRNIVEVSPALERLTGFSKEEVLGRSCLTMMRCTECLQGCGVFRHGTVNDRRITLYRKDGSEIEVSKSGRAIRNEDGEIVGAVETVKPAAGEAMGGLSVSPHMDSLLGSLGRLYVVASGELNVVYGSQELAQLTGFSEDELVGMPLADLLGSDLFGPGGAFANSVLSGQRREGWRAELKSSGGEVRAVSVSAGPIPQGTQCVGSEAAMVLMMRPEEAAAEEGPPEEKNRGHIIARSQPMQRIFKLVDLLRDNDSTVLVTGESGTGKEIVARALHQASHRASGPFVAVNCAALPGELLESELFGHVKGAFTGAVRDRPGRFELADGGTIFLDEIGDLALPLQAKLLRVLQERAFERVGGTKTREVDVRVIAATNQNLQEAVAQHRFREDLYYRLRVVPIDIPPLRQRREDLEPLIRHLLAKIGKDRGRSLRLAPSAMRALLTYPWPGNVRELENALEYATAVCEGQTVHLEDLPLEVGMAENGRGMNGGNGQPHGADGVPGWTGAAFPYAARDPHAIPGPDLHAIPGPGVPGSANPSPLPGPNQPEVLAGPPRAEGMGSESGVVRLSPGEQAEAREIQDALVKARYSRQKAADLLGISRTTLWRKMRQYHLD